MPNSSMAPFERNHYFFGKLLTVRDFQLEQDYMNNKRYLLNRMIHGSGIVNGMQVAADGGSSIKILPGLAIDSYGREIVAGSVIDVADIKHLAGFPSGFGEGILYLYIQSEDVTREPVPSAVNCSCQDQCDYNRIRECFILTLRYQHTPKADTELHHILRERKILFEDEQMRVERIIPKWINPDEVAEVTISVTALQNIGSSEPLQVDVTEIIPSQLTLLNNLNNGKLTFKITGLHEGESKVQRYYVKAGEITSDETISATLQVNGRSKIVRENSTVKIIKDKVRKVIEEYFTSNMGSASSQPDDDGVILAALILDNKGNVTVDQTVRQYVYNNPLLYGLISGTENHYRELPLHALMHQDGGLDELNVNNLSGVLADPQRIAVQKDGGAALTDYTKINFVGNGVAVNGDIQNKRINVTIDNVIPHAASHQKGGADELDVTDLPGVLAEPQKITVQHDNHSYSSTTIHFTGEGVTATENTEQKRIDVTISGSTSSPAQVSSGSVVFQQVKPGELRVSPEIQHKLNADYVAVMLAVESQVIRALPPLSPIDIPTRLMSSGLKDPLLAVRDTSSLRMINEETLLPRPEIDPIPEPVIIIVNVDIQSPGGGSTVGISNTPFLMKGTAYAEDINSGSTFEVGSVRVKIGLEEYSAEVNGFNWTLWLPKVPVTAPGPLTITARAIYGAKSGSDSISVNVTDAVLPAVKIMSPASGQSFPVSGSQAMLSIEGTASDNVTVSKVELAVDNAAYTIAESSNGWANWKKTISVPMGVHSITARCTDTSGNVNTNSITVTVTDTTPPAVKIISPVPGQIFAGDGGSASITVEGTASDNLGVSKVEVAVDNGAYSSAEGSNGWANWKKTISVPVGATHLITAKCTDINGNVNTHSLTVTVSDAKLPEVSIVSPVSGKTFPGDGSQAAITLEGTAADAAGISKVEVAVDNGAYSSAESSNGWADWKKTVTVPMGIHSIIAKATDENGNAGTFSITVNVTDTTLPTVRITNPSTGQSFSGASGSAAITVEGTASDQTGIGKVEITVDNGGYVAAESSNGWASWKKTITVMPGAHTITAKCTDASGNIGTHSISVNVDSTPPTVSILMPANGAKLIGPSGGTLIEIMGTAQDANGIGKVELSLDNSPYILAAEKAPGDWSQWKGALLVGSSGSHVIKARCTDKQNNAKETSITVQVDLMAEVRGSEVRMGDVSSFIPESPRLMASYNPKGSAFRIHLKDQRSGGLDIEWKIRWWAMPKTIDTDTVVVPPPLTIPDKIPLPDLPDLPIDIKPIPDIDIKPLPEIPLPFPKPPATE